MSSDTCAACHQPHALTPHCESHTCTWVRCDADGCHVTYDPDTGHGWDHDHKPITLAR